MSAKEIHMQKINCLTAYRQELQEHILAAAMEEFRRRGVRAVKMDDIAGKLAISKRTLYEIYENKETLLLEALKLHELQTDTHMRAYVEDNAHNVIETIIEFYDIHIQQAAGVNPLFYEELHRYPAVLAFFEEKHVERMHNQNLFFNRGVAEGFFRKDVDFDIVSRIADASMDYVMRTQMYREFNLEYILHNVTLLYVRGICTEAGVRLLDSALGSRDKLCGEKL